MHSKTKCTQPESLQRNTQRTPLISIAMASVQCCKPTSETCQQKRQENSMGQKVTTWVAEKIHHESQTSCHSREQPQYSQTRKMDQVIIAETQTQCVGQTHATDTTGHHRMHHATNGKAICQGNPKKRGEHKKKERKNLLQKIKDGISGNSSDSSSESDSDNDTCGKRKASTAVLRLIVCHQLWLTAVLYSSQNWYPLFSLTIFPRIFLAYSTYRLQLAHRIWIPKGHRFATYACSELFWRKDHRLIKGRLVCVSFHCWW